MLRILDEKINMFELVVGEVGAILGEFEDRHDFSTLVLDAWLRTSEAARATADAFSRLGSSMQTSTWSYPHARALASSCRSSSENGEASTNVLRPRGIRSVRVTSGLSGQCPSGADLLLERDDVGQALQEPRIDSRDLVDFGDAHAEP